MDHEITTTIRLPIELVTALDAIAREQDRPRSWVIRRCLREALGLPHPAHPTHGNSGSSSSIECPADLANAYASSS